MAPRLIRLTATTGDEVFIRPEVIAAFGKGVGFPSSSWLRLWGDSGMIYVRETCQEIATLLTNGAPT